MEIVKIKVKHKRSGEIKEINKNQFGVPHIASNYDKVLEEVKVKAEPKPKPKPKPKAKKKSSKKKK